MKILHAVIRLLQSKVIDTCNSLLSDLNLLIIVELDQGQILGGHRGQMTPLQNYVREGKNWYENVEFKLLFLYFYKRNNICDRACENRAYLHTKFDTFLNFNLL